MPAVWGGEEIVNGVNYYFCGKIIKSGDEGGSELDISHIILKMLSANFTTEPNQNDGLVGRFSMHLGKVINSLYSTAHVDAINHSLGIVSDGDNPLTCYIEHTEILASEGL